MMIGSGKHYFQVSVFRLRYFGFISFYHMLRGQFVYSRHIPDPTVDIIQGGHPGLSQWLYPQIFYYDLHERAMSVETQLPYVVPLI